MDGVTVIGCGAIGRQVATQLGYIGAPRIQLIDFDYVDLPNLPIQGFNESELGRPKTEAVADTIRANNSNCEVSVVVDRWRPKIATNAVVFCCVDDIEVRGTIWKALKDKTDFWADGRMLGENMRVFAAWDEESRDYYTSTLFTNAEAQLGACTARATYPCAAIAAGIMVTQFTKWLREAPTEKEVSLSLFSMEVDVKY